MSQQTYIHFYGSLSDFKSVASIAEKMINVCEDETWLSYSVINKDGKCIDSGKGKLESLSKAKECMISGFTGVVLVTGIINKRLLEALGQLLAVSEMIGIIGDLSSDGISIMLGNHHIAGIDEAGADQHLEIGWRISLCYQGTASNGRKFCQIAKQELDRLGISDFIFGLISARPKLIVLADV
jgi:hypothetical protein